MKYRRLGNSGLKISEISLGSWLTYGHTVDEAQASACVKTAFDLGVNYFDTANSYEGAESLLGKILKQIPREEYLVGTKCFVPLSDSPLNRGLSRKHIFSSVERSLRNLSLDAVDLLFCHRFDPDTPLEETISAINDLIRQGKVLYWGMSCWTAAQITEAYELAQLNGWTPPICHQPPYNLLNRDIERGVLEVSQRLGVGHITYSPLAQGILSGKYGNGIPKGSRADNPDTQKAMHHYNPETIALVEGLKPVAESLDLTLPQLALSWCLQQPGVNSVITGASRPEQVAVNVNASEVEIPLEVMAAIDSVLKSQDSTININ